MIDEVLDTYQATIYSLGAVATLMLVQLLVIDLIGIRHKHEPGMPVSPDHSDFLFRATRALGNTNESISIYIILVIFCILSGASPPATATAS